MTPIEKNVIVVDEQGNEYEATYPKRAKGLVKKGRARFVDENTICLACPPNENLEDKEMSENTNVTNKTVLTEKEVFDQIVLLQKQLNESPYTSLLHLQDALRGARGEEDDANLTDDQVSEICKVFAQREETLNQMLNLYRRMYDDLFQREKMQRNEKIELVKGIWMSYLEKADDVLPEDDKLDAANYVRSQLDLLCADILNDKI